MTPVNSSSENHSKSSDYSIELQTAILQILVYTPFIYQFDDDPLNLFIPFVYFIISYIKRRFVKDDIENILSVIEIISSAAIVVYLFISSPYYIIYIIENSLLWFLVSASMFFSGIISLLRNSSRFNTILKGFHFKSINSIFLLYYCNKELKNINKTIPLSDSDKHYTTTLINKTYLIVKTLSILIGVAAVIFMPALIYLSDSMGFILFVFSWLAIMLLFISFHVRFFNRLSSLKKDFKSNNKSIINEPVQDKFVRVFKPEDVCHYLSIRDNEFMVMPDIFDMFNIHDTLYLEYLTNSGVVLNFYRSESTVKNIDSTSENLGIKIYDAEGIKKANKRYFNEAGCYCSIVSFIIIFYLVKISEIFSAKHGKITAGEYIFIDILIIILLFFINQALKSYKRARSYDC